MIPLNTVYDITTQEKLVCETTSGKQLVLECPMGPKCTPGPLFFYQDNMLAVLTVLTGPR